MIVSDSKILQILRDAGKIHREIIDELFQTGLLSEWHTGIEIEEWIIQAQKKRGVESAFLGQYKYPANIILSVNDVVVHGVPADIPFESGDVVKVDYGIRYKTFLTDAATTIIIGTPNNVRHVRCIEVLKDALVAGIEQAKAGNFVGDISAAIETTVTQGGFHIIRELTGHGLGTKIHEKPDIYNFRRPDRGEKLQSWLYIAIEPIVGFTTGKIFDTQNFAICMDDGNIGVQEEHCGIVGEEGFEIIV